MSRRVGTLVPRKGGVGQSCTEGRGRILLSLFPHNFVMEMIGTVCMYVL